jgi:hypothetical protein
MLLHSQNLGLKVSGRIICTGGASKNIHILQVVSDVFGVPVYVGVRHFVFKDNKSEKLDVRSDIRVFQNQDQANSASLGAAYRALHGFCCVKENKYFFCTSLKKTIHGICFSHSLTTF